MSAAALVLSGVSLMVSVTALAVAWRAWSSIYAWWRTWESHQQAVQAAAERLETPVSLTSSGGDLLTTAVENGPAMFHQLRGREAALAAARAGVQASCPHVGVQPSGYCDACQGHAPG
jgi:hypothetical protein